MPLRVAAREPNPTDWWSADDASLRCEVSPERDAVRVRPMGSLDLATVSVLEQQLQELREAGFRRLIVDLGGLRFMDSTGLRLALRWHAAAQQDGFEIGFVPGPPPVQRVFEVTGMSEHVPFIRP
jgi:anti-sigma B factor antagonist